MEEADTERWVPKRRAKPSAVVVRALRVEEAKDGVPKCPVCGKQKKIFSSGTEDIVYDIRSLPLWTMLDIRGYFSNSFKIIVLKTDWWCLVLEKLRTPDGLL